MNAQYTGAIARALQTHKKYMNVKSIRQGYKGTGSKSAKRQLWVRFQDGSVTDIWLMNQSAVYGGVVPISIAPSGTPYGEQTPEQVAQTIANHLHAYTATKDAA
jgi:hypothetical protein